MDTDCSLYKSVQQQLANTSVRVLIQIHGVCLWVVVGSDPMVAPRKVVMFVCQDYYMPRKVVMSTTMPRKVVMFVCIMCQA